jgi:putative oxidoreductase
LAIGFLVVVGLLTGPAAAGLIGVMFVAFWSVHRHNGVFIFRPGEGREYVATLALIGATIAIAGPGNASLDNALSVDATFDGWVGAALVGGAITAAAVQLALFFRPESTRT